MNLDTLFGLKAADVLVQTNPLLLGACILAAAAAGWWCAWRWRDTSDFGASTRYYLPAALAGTVLFTLLGVPLLFAAGAQLCGFAAMALISNHYFYH